MLDFLPKETFKLAADLIPKVFNKLLKIRAQKQREIDQIADTFGDPFQLAKYYVEPDCQQFNPADDDEEEISYLVREPIFRRLESFLGGQKREGKHQLFILSDAGMGKTAILVMLKLAHLTSFWPRGYECILYKLDSDTLIKTKEILGRRNVVLLLDALDEDPLAWGRIRDRLIEILQETYNFRRVIITCRTQFFSAEEDPFNRRGQVEVGGFLCPVIFNSLFSDKQTEEYLRKRFRGRNDAEDLISRAKRITQSMGSLKSRPMLLAHIEDFLEVDREVSWNEYTIYETLVKVWLMREQRKKLLRTEARPSIDELWLACRTLALNLQRSGRHEIKEMELSHLINQHPFLGHIPTMDVTGRSLLNKNSKGNYRFSHYSVQEFLLVNGSIQGSINLIEENIKPTAQMNSFLAAWLADPKREGHIPVDRKAYRLSGCNLVGARFDGEDSREMVLDSADLRSATFANTQLQWANLRGVDLRGAHLRTAELHWAKLDGAKYDSKTVWPVSGPPEGTILLEENDQSPS